jgi:hypothetical protein
VQGQRQLRNKIHVTGRLSDKLRSVLVGVVSMSVHRAGWVRDTSRRSASLGVEPRLTRPHFKIWLVLYVHRRLSSLKTVTWLNSRFLLQIFNIYKYVYKHYIRRSTRYIHSIYNMYMASVRPGWVQQIMTYLSYKGHLNHLSYRWPPSLYGANIANIWFILYMASACYLHTN